MSQGAVVESGALVLRSSNSPASDLLTVEHRFTLSGDFTATFELEAFTSGGDGAFVQAAIAENVANPVTPIGTAGIGHFSQQGSTVPGISAAFQPGAVDLQATTATAGSFSFQRTGASVTVTAQPSQGPIATVTNASYGTFDVTIGVQIGNNLPRVIAAPSSIRILSFVVTGGGPAPRSDPFDCDSLSGP
jgi:hypothetical protein